MADEDEAKKREVIQSFVRALGGGSGSYVGESSKTFEQNESPNFGDRAETDSHLGLGFGRIKFTYNDQSTPYIRIPWKKEDKYNMLRAQARKLRKESTLIS